MNRSYGGRSVAASQASTPLLAVLVEGTIERDVLTFLGDYTVTDLDVTAWRGIALGLAIMDLPSLLKYERPIRELRERTPLEPISVLLVVDDATLPKSQTVLGYLADDLIRAPISRIELRARIDNLLRLRRLPDTRPLDIEPSAPELSGVAKALHAFSAGNDRTIRACSEQEILSDICKSLTLEGGYPLAWIGQQLPDKGNSIRPVTCSGRYCNGISHVQSVGKGDVIGLDAIRDTFKTGGITQANIPEEVSRPVSGQTLEMYRPTAVIVFPFTRRGTALSTCLAIYSSDAVPFDDNEIELLQRLIDNALHAIHALREKFSQQRREHQAIRLAYRDSLTGLANRAAILRALANGLERSGPYPPATALLYLDLDGFKLINDGLGHDVGDSILIEVSRRLQSAVREIDLVARNGGDEFVILLPLDSGANKIPIVSKYAHAEARTQAEFILEALQKPFVIDGRNYHIESSLGIGLCPGHAREAFSLFMKADSARYEAKKIVGNSFRFFSQELSERQQKRLELESRLYQSVETAAFEIALQPIVDLNDGHIVAAEALLRWPQSDGTYISPGEFIPIAEETGLIVPIGDWVMEESLRTIRRLRDHGFTELQITVNLAIAQLWQTHLVDRTVSLMRDLGLPTSALKVELTEGSLMNDMERMEEVVRGFRATGIEVAIDDFGTGYSSLARLRSLPITTLKIDRSFLNGVPAEENAVSFVNTIANMANNLGIQSIAEGIETEAQWQTLQQLGCQLGQGFYFARPLPEHELLNLLRDQEGMSG